MGEITPGKKSLPVDLTQKLSLIEQKFKKLNESTQEEPTPVTEPPP